MKTLDPGRWWGCGLPNGEEPTMTTDQITRPASPDLRWSVEGDVLTIAVEGPWVIDNSRRLEDLSAIADQEIRPGRKISVDAKGITALDTLGSWILHRLQGQGATSHIDTLPEKFQALYARVLRAADAVETRPARRRRSIGEFIDAIAEGVADAGREAAAQLAMLGALAEATARALRRPGAFRLTSFVYQLDRVCWQAIPLVLLITFLIGCIIAQQGFFHFRKFGAEDYVVDLVGVLVLREIAVLLVAIMVAGRSGSSYAAELGAMKMREELDALRTMGLDPVDVLMLPRVLALLAAVPILAFLGALAALAGGGLVAVFYGGMGPEIFATRLREAVSLTHFEVGIIKAPFMAAVIGMVACAEGMKVRGSAESLGKQTTSSVVKSIFLVIVIDGVFAIFFASIGM